MKTILTMCLALCTATLIGCGGSSTAAKLAPMGGATAPASDRATATLAYWNGLNSLPAQMAADLRGGPQKQVQALREAADIIRTNPVLGVDPELTSFAQRLATSLQQRADLIEQSRNPAILAEAFLRGASGDPFGAAIELNEAERAWLASFQALTREQGLLRARLTARYSIEFPPP